MDLKVRRVKVRRTQQDVATALGVSRSQVAKVEAIRGDVPSETARAFDTVLRTYERVSTTEAA